MKASFVLKFATAIAAFGLLAAPVSAKSVWDQLGDSAPRTDGVFGDLQSTAPRSPFDQINTSAPRSPFDQIDTSAPRSPFDQINSTAPVRGPDKDLVGE